MRAMTCKYFGTCGGCSPLAASYAEQLERKRDRLVGLLGRDVPPLIPSPRESAFRQKAAFVFGSGPRGRGLLMGHYAARSNHVVPVDECPVHSARANRIAFALRDRLVRANVGAADTRGGVLRHLIVRTTEDDAEAVAMLVVTRNDKALRAPVRGLLASADAPDGFFININTRPGPYMVGAETIKISGRSHVRERGFTAATGDAPIDFLVSPDAFFQTNVGAARRLVQLVLDGVGPSARVLDLYCGSGLFALPLARRGATVTAVEESRTAITDLKANAKLNRIAPARVVPIAGRVEDAIGRLAGTRWDAVVLDPPRDGCAPGVLSAVFERTRPPRVVYVSCNPEVLALDLRSILKAGYRVDRLQAIDMFPHTEHIETVVTLSRTAGG
jgi:23S rRNA (uracil1939-C5)-methyltransferase